MKTPIASVRARLGLPVIVVTLLVRGALKLLGETPVAMGLINEATLRLVLSQQAPPAPEQRQTGAP